MSFIPILCILIVYYVPAMYKVSLDRSGHSGYLVVPSCQPVLLKSTLKPLKKQTIGQ